MYERSTTFQNRIMDAHYPQKCLLLFEDCFFDNDDIADNGVHFEEYFCTSTNLTFGDCPSSTVSFDIISNGRLGGYNFGIMRPYIGVEVGSEDFTFPSGVKAHIEVADKVIEGSASGITVDGTRIISGNYLSIVSDGTYAYAVGTSSAIKLKIADLSYEVYTPNQFMVNKLRKSKSAVFDGSTGILTEWEDGAKKTIEMCPMGAYNVEKPRKTTDMIVTISDAHDFMSKFDMDASEFIGGLSYPITLSQIFVNLCQYIGVEYVSSDFLYGSTSYNASPFTQSSMKCRDVLSYIASRARCIAHFNKDGKLELIWLSEDSVETVEQSNLVLNEQDIAEYETAPITGVLFKSSNGTSLSYGDKDNPYPVVANPFIATITNTDLEAYESLPRYTPMEVSVIRANPAVDVGDVINIESGDNRVLLANSFGEVYGEDVGESEFHLYANTDGEVLAHGSYAQSTESGSVATFTSEYDHPFTDVTATITPVQSGSGDPYPPGGGKNLINPSTIIPNKGITVDGSIVNINTGNYTDLISVDEGYDYVFSATSKNSSSWGRRIHAYDSSGNWVMELGYTGTPNGIAVDTRFSIHVFISTGISYVRCSYRNDDADAQFEKGQTATAYAPYANIRPISGFTGVNIWDDPKHGGNIVWNQLVTNGDFSDGTTGWSATASAQSSLSVVDGTLVLTHTVTSNRRYGIAHDVALISGHKYLLSGEMKKTFANTDSDARTIVFYLDSKSYEITRWSNLTQNQVVNLDTIFTASISAYRVILQTVGAVDIAASNDSILELTKPFMIFDLTVMFGSGNEPTTVDEFKALFPKSYYDYDSGSGNPTCVSAVNGDLYSVTPVSWQSEVGTVYGGTVNVATGKLTVNFLSETYDGSEAWSKRNSGAYTYFGHKVGDNGYFATGGTGWSNIFIKTSLTSSNTVVGFNSANSSAYNGAFINVRPPNVASFADADAFKTWLSSNNLQVVYQLATPIEYDLSPTEISALIGQNNVWADANGDVSVTYDSSYIHATTAIGKNKQGHEALYDIDAPSSLPLMKRSLTYVGMCTAVYESTGDKYRNAGEVNDTEYNADVAPQIAYNMIDATLTQEDVFNRLTNNGEAQGIFLSEDGNLYVNATYVKTGTLSAVNIDLGDGNFTVDGLTGEIVIKEGSIDLGGGKFTVDNDGYIHAERGSIGGFSITDSMIWSVSNNYSVPDHTMYGYYARIHRHSDDWDSTAPFIEVFYAPQYDISQKTDLFSILYNGTLNCGTANISGANITGGNIDITADAVDQSRVEVKYIYNGYEYYGRVRPYGTAAVQVAPTFYQSSLMIPDMFYTYYGADYNSAIQRMILAWRTGLEFHSNTNNAWLTGQYASEGHFFFPWFENGASSGANNTGYFTVGHFDIYYNYQNEPVRFHVVGRSLDVWCILQFTNSSTIYDHAVANFRGYGLNNGINIRVAMLSLTGAGIRRAFIYVANTQTYNVASIDEVHIGGYAKHSVVFERDNQYSSSSMSSGTDITWATFP